nr:hypothetical protein Iba_chr04aCG1010 [Ipomoea batatas]
MLEKKDVGEGWQLTIKVNEARRGEIPCTVSVWVISIKAVSVLLDVGDGRNLRRVSSPRAAVFGGFLSEFVGCRQYRFLMFCCRPSPEISFSPARFLLVAWACYTARSSNGTVV